MTNSVEHSQPISPSVATSAAVTSTKEYCRIDELPERLPFDPGDRTTIFRTLRRSKQTNDPLPHFYVGDALWFHVPSVVAWAMRQKEPMSKKIKKVPLPKEAA